MPVPYVESILTAHNLLFTILTVILVLPKAMLAYLGQSVAPTTLDLVYGLAITLSYFWLDAYKCCNPTKAAWYFKRSLPSVLHDFWCDLNTTVRPYVIRIRDTLREAEEGRRRTANPFSISLQRRITTEPSLNLPRKNWRKALLIGICYEQCDDMETLVGSHQDVIDLRQILISMFDYAPEDIVIMLDKPSLSMDGNMPTRDNILTQMSSMVQGAAVGDRFFFHYSGHSKRIEHASHAKGGRLDGAIIPCDGKPMVNSELKQYLVEPLPVGTSLVAVLDACHSGSLLDLKHHRCNRVYTPRISGKRRRRSLYNEGSQDDADDLDTWDFDDANSAIRRVSADINTFSHPPLPCIKSVPERSHQQSTITIPKSINSSTERCDLSAQYECDGHCRQSSWHAAETAHVVCITACKDSQIAWDGPDGTSFTRDLIQILENNSRPSLRNLMTMLSTRAQKRFFQGYSTCRQPNPHLSGRIIKRSQSDSVLEDLENIQHPQIASHKPLSMDETLVL